MMKMKWVVAVVCLKNSLNILLIGLFGNVEMVFLWEVDEPNHQQLEVEQKTRVAHTHHNFSKNNCLQNRARPLQEEMKYIYIQITVSNEARQDGITNYLVLMLACVRVIDHVLLIELFQNPRFRLCCPFDCLCNLWLCRICYMQTTTGGYFAYKRYKPIAF
jgi:hypothetical protein